MQIKKLIPLLLLVPLLVGCFQRKPQEPEIPFDELMRSAKQNTMEAEFGTVQFSVSLKGGDVAEQIEGGAEVEFAFNRSGDTTEHQLGGVIQGERRGSDGVKSLQMDLNTLRVSDVVQDEWYVFLNSAQLSGNPELDGFQAFLQPYMSMWLKIPSQQLPEGFQQFQVQQGLLEQENELSQQIFVSTKLFDLQEYHGVKTAGSQQRDAYYYSVNLNQAGVENYYQQIAAALNNASLSPEELESVTAGFQYVQGIELWIDIETFRVLEARVLLSGEDLWQSLQGDPLELEVELSIMADFGTPVSLEAPVEFTEFDPLLGFTQLAELPVIQNVEVEGDGLVQ